MKIGRTLNELAAELTRQAQSKKDIVAPTTSMEVLVQDDKPMLRVGGYSPTEINEVAHDQIGTHTGIPAKYYDKMRAEAPDLLANNINRWFAKYPATRLVRHLDNRARAFLSNGYKPLENYDLANAILPVLADLKVEIMSCEVTERRLYIKAVDERVRKDIPTGHSLGDGSHKFFDTLSPAIIVSNSEVGYGQLSVETGMFTHMCTNLAAFADGGMKRRHIGARHALTDGEAVTALLTDETRAATDKAIWMQARDVVRGAFDEVRFEKRVETVRGLASQPLDGDPVKVVELSAKKFGATEEEGVSILQHLVKGGDLTRYGLFNAVTRTAQDLKSYDRATEFEKFGGQLIDLPANEWKQLQAA